MAETPKFKRRSEARPDEILDAALGLFLVKGFAQTTVEEIAAAASLSKGTVYLYFASKEALLEGLVHRAVSPLAERAVSELETGHDHPRDTLARVLTSIAKAMNDDMTAAVPMLVIREAATVPSIAAIYRDEVLSHVVPALAGLLSRAQARGLIRQVDPELTVRTIAGPIFAHLILSKVFDLRPAGGVQLDRLVANHLDIVFHGITPSAEVQ